MSEYKNVESAAGALKILIDSMYKTTVQQRRITLYQGISWFSLLLLYLLEWWSK